MISRIRSWIPLSIALAGLIGSADAAGIRDEAGMFGQEAVREAQEQLDRIEDRYRVPIVIETVESLGGRSIDEVSAERAQRSGSRGLYILVAENEKTMEVRDFRSFLGPERRGSIRQAFLDGFRTGNLDSGLLRGVEASEEVFSRGGNNLRPPDAAPGQVPARGAGRPQVGGGLGLLLPILIGGGLLFLLFRVIGRLFGGAGRSAPMGGPGGPMGGPGGQMGGYGYGRGGGGLWSGLFGGLGGALAGNWLYDQFSGRHHDSGHSQTPTDYGASDPGADWGGAGEAGSWGGDGGGGGDWGGGDAGGGDWGGGDGGGSW